MDACSRDDLFRRIAARGGRYGECGGLLDLLNWCGKLGLFQVTTSEARFYLEHPCASYGAYLATCRPCRGGRPPECRKKGGAGE